MAIKVNAEIRKVAGKGAARAVRNNKNIPAVIYGEKKEPVSIELNGHEIEMLLKQSGLRTKLFQIKTSGGQEDAVLMDIQYHPVSDRPMHIDFKRIDVKKPVDVTVPVEIINIDVSKGIKLGGVLNFAVRKVALKGLIDVIPEKIVVDLTNLTIGEAIHGTDLNLPKGVELGLRQGELAFATIGGKMPEEEAQKPVAAAPAPAKK